MSQQKLKFLQFCWWKWSQIVVSSPWSPLGVMPPKSAPPPHESWRPLTIVEQPLHICSQCFGAWGVFGFASSSVLHFTSHPQTTSAIYLGLLSKNCRDSRDWPVLLTNGKQNDSSNDSHFNPVPYRDDNMTHTVETFDTTRIPVRFTASSIISSCEVQ